jgi:hypothetical protein
MHFHVCPLSHQCNRLPSSCADTDGSPISLVLLLSSSMVNFDTPCGLVCCFSYCWHATMCSLCRLPILGLMQKSGVDLSESHPLQCLFAKCTSLSSFMFDTLGYCRSLVTLLHPLRETEGIDKECNHISMLGWFDED